jgi:S-adenosylmethionine-diacylglycerol 3-amino-3-carboxypropyl transferase
MEISRIDFFSLSNIFDWSSSEEIKAISDKFNSEAKPGSVILIRQLNNENDLASYFTSYSFDHQLGQELLEKDRSMFYNRILIGVKKG